MAGFDHFNFIGPIYDYIFGRGGDREIVNLARVQPDSRMLDVGGGTGRVSALFQGKVGLIQIVDTALKMLREAQKKGITSVVAESERLPYEAGAFDRIILVDALHHVADQQGTLDEMWRLLAPGGWMIVEEPDIRNFSVKLIALMEKVLLMRSHFLSPSQIEIMAGVLPSSRVEIVQNRGVAWVIINKPNDQSDRS